MRNISDVSEALRKMLDEGNAVIGQLLKAFSSATITPEEIVAEFEKGTPVLILDRAKKIIAGKKLYKEWLNFYGSQMQDIKQQESHSINK